jgi:multiple sugar transport system ATP-binding protein
MPDIELRDLTIKYGATAAVSGVSLDVLDREYCVLLGPSGCGKTSILRAIAGFAALAAGAIRIGGRDVTRLYPGDRDVAMIFQDYALYPHMTVRGNFAFPLQAMRLGRAEQEQRIREVAQLLRMEDLLDRYPRELSGGQQQRVAVGRALVRRCPVLLLDEPLGNLDAKLRVETRASLKRIQRDLAVTAVHVTHDQVEALALADRIVVMEQGEIRQIGSPEQVYERPDNLFVAQFVGTPAMNVLPCRLQQEGERWLLVGAGFHVPVEHRRSRLCSTPWSTAAPPNDRRAAKPDGPPWRSSDLATSPGCVPPPLANYRDRAILLGIRAEHVRLAPEPGPDYFPAQVYVTEPQGSEVIVDMQVGGEIVRARGDKEEWAFAAQGQTEVYAAFPFPRAHLFDPDTHRRIEV